LQHTSAMLGSLPTPARSALAQNSQEQQSHVRIGANEEKEQSWSEANEENEESFEAQETSNRSKCKKRDERNVTKRWLTWPVFYSKRVAWFSLAMSPSNALCQDGTSSSLEWAKFGSYYISSQIWLIPLVDDRQSTYFRKLEN
jgi:hypothetical protein